MDKNLLDKFQFVEQIKTAPVMGAVCLIVSLFEIFIAAGRDRVHNPTYRP